MEMLEEDKHNKGLSLDPPRTSHHHPLYQHPRQQDPHHHNNNNNDEEEDDEHNSSPSSGNPHPHYQQQNSTFHFHHHPYFQQHLDLEPEQEPLQQPKKWSSFLPPPHPNRPPPTTTSSSFYSIEYARKMGETTHDHHTGAPETTTTTTTTKPAATSSKRIAGEIVEVQGGHIVRSTGRKDRHSKVCTAKGPRDRRVRLSAHTAIQFYDVQDRLGYDRPSKAVDWLIKKAKSAIDELAQLPAWNPTATCSTTPQQQQQQQQQLQQQQTNEMFNRQSPVDNHQVTASTSHRSAAALERRMPPQQEQFSSQQLELDYNNSSGGKHGFLQGSLDTDIADTIKSFFPVETQTTSFHSYPQPPDLLSRTAVTTQQQDLRLSLQSFQDPILLQSHHDNHHHHNQVLFAGNSSLGDYDGGGSGSTLWSEQQQQQQQEENDNGRLHRMMAWNANANVNAADGGNSGHGGGFVFSAPAAPTFGGYGQFFTQRGPLQSSYNPSVRAWIDPSMAATANIADHHHHYLSPMIHQASVSGGGFSGFRIPARIQGEEEHDGVSDKPSSASSDSHH
ncbi:hypothetical protein TSUD_372190 [Trifolium subterraneum]|uniref:TCP domain-containing protein n=1 Tax=Trifolium subterraneum TaxID=3900 RepID=A0A2Z6MES7_TRISU|nr:hypothetical protein TSUD_372190 [Trifolium subterraneum]